MKLPNVIAGKPIVAVTFWNEDLEGNRVGEAVRVEIPPGQHFVLAPPELDELDETGWPLYSLCGRLRPEGE